MQRLGYTVGSFALLPSISFANTRNQFNPLVIPAILTGTQKGGIKTYQLTAQQGISNFLPGLETETWGFNGAYLGPVLRAKKGDKIRIEVTNHLKEPTTTHWHGMILPAKMDGGPHQDILPNQPWISEYSIIQPAASLFYHAHPHGKTGDHVYRGLAGMFIIDDDESLQKGLPTEYGVDDVPLILQDRDINSDGSLNYINFMPERMTGKHGKTLLVNGGVSASLKAQKTLLRFRLLNASNARFYHLHFNDNRPFQVIASDGGLLDTAKTVQQLAIAPAERYEILVDVSDKKQIMLQSAGGLGNAGHGPMAMRGMDRDFDVLMIDATQATKTEHTVPKQLTQYADWSQQNIANRRTFDLQMGMGGGMMGGGRMGGGMGNRMMGHGREGGGMMGGGHMGAGMMKINDQAFDINRIDFSLKPNTFEIWEITNSSGMVHPFHVHNTQFRILSRNGRQPNVNEQGYKDTVVIHRRETVKILLPTGPYSDAKMPYMYHCHILEHEDGGMMGQFTVNG